MASASGIRAGSAYVELAVNDSKLVKGLRSAAKQLKEFGGGLRDLGTQMTLIGAGMVTPLIAVVKSFADAGDQLGKLQAKTGLGLDALNGLVEAARQADVPIEALSVGMVHLSRAIAGGSKETAETFERLGTSAAELAKKSPEEALALLADRLKEITDLNEKAAIAQTLFGKSGVDLLPALAEGSAGLNEAANAARKSGTAFSGDALAAAQRLDDGFKGLEGSLMRLRNAMGAALESAILPLIEGLSTGVQAAAQWVSQNPGQVQAFFNLGLAIGALGVAFTVLGAAIYAAMTPALLAAAAVLGIGMAMLAVTDILGVTQTGFGDLFNAIRIDGTGLGTWFAAFTIELAKMWNDMASFMEFIWDEFINGAKNAGSYIYQALVWVPQKLLQAFRWMVDSAGELLNGLASVWNATLGTVAGKIEMKFGSAGVFDDAIDGLQSKQDEIAGDRAKRNKNFDADQDAKFRMTNLIEAELNRQEQELFEKDPQDSSTGIHLDTKKFKDGLAGIGGNIGQLMRDLLGQIPELTGFKPDADSALSPFKLNTGTINNAIESAQKHVDVVGTFNAAAAGEMGFGSSIQERTAKASEETARNTRQTLDLVRNNSASFS